MDGYRDKLMDHDFLANFVVSAAEKDKLYIIKKCTNKKTGEIVDVLAIEVETNDSARAILLPVAEFSNSDPYGTWEPPATMEGKGITAMVPVTMN